MKNGKGHNDKELVEGCIDKDPASWTVFTKRFSRLIRISANNRLRKYGFALPSHDLEDIVQNVLTSLWRDELLKSVKNVDNISYWLSMVSGNIAIEYLRKTRKEPSASRNLVEPEGLESFLEDILESNSPSPSDAALREELIDRIESAIDSLPDKEKLIIKLNVLHDKKYEEISDILGMPTGTVSSYIKRVKQKMRKTLKDFK